MFSIKNMFLYNKNLEEKEKFVISPADKSDATTQYNETQQMIKSPVSCDLEVNYNLISQIYTYPKNSDVNLRRFHIVVENVRYKCIAIFIDGLVSRDTIGANILEPLMSVPMMTSKSYHSTNIGEIVENSLLTANQLSTEKTIQPIIEKVNFGACAIFVDTIDTVYVCDVKGWEHRTVSKPDNEQTIEGPKEAFNEVLRVNTALVRKFINTEDLICESHKLGKVSKTPAALLYLKSVANDSLVSEARRRITGVDTDYLLTGDELVEFIEEKTFMISPELLVTERPDRVARCLTEGRVAIIVNGSPSAIIAPANIFEMMYTPEDIYNRYIYANFLRFVRLFALLISVLLPAIYLAVTLFHKEILPTDLLYSLVAAKKNVPFSMVIELVLMELSFDLIREAGLRVPSPIGPTVGIIGALILGQAAVAANIVSPITIIIVALTGLGSFATPNYPLGLAARVLRYIFVFSAAIAGLAGVGMAIFIYLIILCNQKSFGVPMSAPIAATQKSSFGGIFFIKPLWQMEKRPNYLKTKRERVEPNISRKWDK